MQAFAPAFAKAGAKAVVLVARNEAKLNETAAEIKKINPDVETLVVSVDITDKEQVQGLFEQIQAKYGHADILVNNAGELLLSRPNLCFLSQRPTGKKKKNRNPQSRRAPRLSRPRSLVARRRRQLPRHLSHDQLLPQTSANQ